MPRRFNLTQNSDDENENNLTQTNDFQVKSYKNQSGRSKIVHPTSHDSSQENEIEMTSLIEVLHHENTPEINKADFLNQNEDIISSDQSYMS